MKLASRRGVTAICLSVETSNLARALYTSHGFCEVSSGQGSVTMLRDLGA